MKLRSHLFVLTAAATLPIVVFSAVVATLLVERERDLFRRAATERTRALMTAVDAELRGSITTLQVLATSRSLERDDLRAFHEEARRALASRPGWLGISLVAPSGRHVLHTRRPYGAELPAIADEASLARALRTLAPAVGGVRVGPVTGRPGVSVLVPVLLRRGAPAYALAASVSTEAFLELLRAQRLPPDWAIAIADADARFVARIPEHPAGAPAAPGFSAALKGEAPEGWFRARTVEGRDTSQSYSRSAFSGWGVGIAVPQREIEATALHTAAAMGAGAAAALALAFALAVLLGRRIAGPIDALASGAHAIGRGDAVELEAPGRVAEFARVAAALKDAAAAVRLREETQRRAEEALRAANRSKDEFLATLSHELRNPLGAISMSARVLRRASGDERLVRQTADILERQSAQMTRLVEDLLDMSRVTFGKVAVDPVPMDLAGAAERLASTWRSAGRLGAHDVGVETAPAWIRGDPARIEQIVSNLLDNAVKFTPAGGRIVLRVARRGGEAVLEVADSGAGFPDGLAGRVFDLFVQGERTLDRPGGGLGIGLALVKRLAELHGGAAEAHSAGPGRGTTFTVRFPAIEPPGDEATPPQARAGRRAQRSILVVEDNRDARAMLRAALTAEGHTVREAEHGAAALAALEEARPEVAIIDIGLPGIDGYELARRMRSKVGREVLLVALTGYGHAEDKHRAVAAGFDAHLTKPVDPARLESLLSSMTG